MKKLFAILALSVALSLLVSCSETKAPEPAQKPPDEMATIAALREINEGQAIFIKLTRRYAQFLSELVKDHQIKKEPKKGEIGYDIFLIMAPDAVSYTMTATPMAPGGRYFFTDQTGVIRAEKDKPATAASPEL
jgi:hypothetical protein